MNIKIFKFIEMNCLYTTYILKTVQESTNNIMDKKYKNLHQKLNKLERGQPPPTRNSSLNFHPRVVNHTTISFSPEEFKLPNKGLKYNLSNKRKKLDKRLSNGSRDSRHKITNCRPRLCKVSSSTKYRTTIQTV